MLIFLIILSIVVNAIYLFAFRLLMEKLKHKASFFWLEIGSPNSFSVNHGGSMVSNLYKKRMRNACATAGCLNLLNFVQILLVAGFLITGITFFFIARAVDT